MREKEVDFYWHLANVLSLALVGAGAVFYTEIKAGAFDFTFAWFEILFLTILVVFAIATYVYAYRIIKGRA